MIIIPSNVSAYALVITYSIGAAGSGGSGAANGETGGTTTINFLETTLTATGGGGGLYDENTFSNGGIGLGGDWDSPGGKGYYARGDIGGGGGGALYGSDASLASGVDNARAGGYGASCFVQDDALGLEQVLDALGVAYSSGGGRGGSGSTPENEKNGGDAPDFGCGGGGAGWYGGKGGNGLYGGGGGGAAGFSVTKSGGNGGSGVVVARFVGTTTTYSFITSGTSYTIPEDTTEMTLWAVGAGGGGAGVPSEDGVAGGGGAAGGVAYKTWVF